MKVNKKEFHIDGAESQNIGGNETPFVTQDINRKFVGVEGNESIKPTAVLSIF